MVVLAIFVEPFAPKPLHLCYSLSKLFQNALFNFLVRDHFHSKDALFSEGLIASEIG